MERSIVMGCNGNKELFYSMSILLSFYVSSADSKCKEESAKLLGCLIRNCERLILPYIAPIHKVLLVVVLKIHSCFILFCIFLVIF